MLGINEIRDGIIEQKTKTELLIKTAESEMKLAWNEYEKRKKEYDRLNDRIQAFEYALNNMECLSEEA